MKIMKKTREHFTKDELIAELIEVMWKYTPYVFDKYTETKFTEICYANLNEKQLISHIRILEDDIHTISAIDEWLWELAAHGQS